MDGSKEYLIVLGGKEQERETVFHSEKLDEVIVWAKEWLRVPIGLAITIIPPSVTTF